VPPFFIFTNFLYNKNIEKKMVDLWTYLKREEKVLHLLSF
jgi:hypothetical protein